MVNMSKFALTKNYSICGKSDVVECVNRVTVHFMDTTTQTSVFHSGSTTNWILNHANAR